jgi:parvulin-like peptidyl-prolyl isomerase
MRVAFHRLWSWRSLRRVALGFGGVVAVAAGVLGVRGFFFHRATAQPAAVNNSRNPAASVPAERTVPAAASDYADRVVAYIHTNQPITRQDLGEYLLARYGADKLPLLLNKRILDKACAEQGINVTIADIDAALAEHLKGLAIDQTTFMKSVLGKYRKNLFEWKQDVLRPRLQMTRLVQSRLTVTDDELHKVFESAYGEKVECRIILWPLDQEQQALGEYGKLRDSEAAFADKAKKQWKSELAATGGKLQPIARHTMDPNVEREVFKLQPGQVTVQIKTPQGIVMLKCDKRIPADTTVNFDAAKEKLAADIKERKLTAEMAAVFQALTAQARPQPLVKKSERAETGPTPPPNQVVAYLFGSTAVTREELGEFLIARYGAEKLEFLVNRRIIDAECKARNITVTEDEIEEGLKEDLKMLNLDKAHFEKDLLARWGKNLYEWREDVIHPKLLMTKMCKGRVGCTEEDLKKGFEAYYGERLKCRLILWPPDQHKFAMQLYPTIRDSEAEFARAAKNQPSGNLASHGGEIPIFGRNTLGDENLEREAFKLQPGEVSALIGTPQGHAVIKCDKRIEPDKSVKLEQVRDKLTKEVLDKKVQIEMQVVFGELRKKANPRFLLKASGAAEDLKAITNDLMSGLPGRDGKAAKK